MKLIRKFFGIDIDNNDVFLYVINDSLHVYWRKGRLSKDSWDYWTFLEVRQVGSVIADGYTSVEVLFTIKGKRITFDFTHFFDNATLRLYYPSIFI